MIIGTHHSMVEECDLRAWRSAGREESGRGRETDALEAAVQVAVVAATGVRIGVRVTAGARVRVRDIGTDTDTGSGNCTVTPCGCEAKMYCTLGSNS